jgi:hypothetical protein
MCRLAASGAWTRACMFKSSACQDRCLHREERFVSADREPRDCLNNSVLLQRLLHTVRRNSYSGFPSYITFARHPGPLPSFSPRPRSACATALGRFQVKNRQGPNLRPRAPPRYGKPTLSHPARPLILPDGPPPRPSLPTGYELFKLQRYNHLSTPRPQHNSFVIPIIPISREPA